jgi:citrate lyase beta subunit
MKLTIRSKIRLIACIESAKGLLNIKEIASADPAVDALVCTITIPHRSCG